MAIRQLFTRFQPIVNRAGEPVPGAKVHVFRPNTEIYLASFEDSAFQVENQAPVKASGSGRCDVWVNANCDIRVTDRNDNEIAFYGDANPDFQESTTSGGLIANGSFEIDSSGDGVPDKWDVVELAGATIAIDSDLSTDGANSLEFVAAGSGGGTATTEDFFPVNDVEELTVKFDIIASIATLLCKVTVQWYDIAQAIISNDDVYSSAANPLVWTGQTVTSVPPSGARFAKIQITGVDPTGATLSGSVNFDRFNVFYPVVVSGTFDNITITGNTIRSDNTDGEINLTPNGAGEAQVNGNKIITELETAGRLLDAVGHVTGATTVDGVNIASVSNTSGLHRVVFSNAAASDHDQTFVAQGDYIGLANDNVGVTSHKLINATTVDFASVGLLRAGPTVSLTSLYPMSIHRAITAAP